MARKKGSAPVAEPAPAVTLEETLKEVMRCTREGIRINTFMLDETYYLRSFVEQMMKVNGGRAFFTNADHAAIYIALHAASSGRGIRIYTALLPFGDDDRGPFRSWPIAQHSSLPLSRRAASAVAAELLKRLGCEGKAVLVDVTPDEKLARSVRNIPGVSFVPSARTRYLRSQPVSGSSSARANPPSLVSSSKPSDAISRRPTLTTRGMSPGNDSKIVVRPCGSEFVVTRPMGL